MSKKALSLLLVLSLCISSFSVAFAIDAKATNSEIAVKNATNSIIEIKGSEDVIKTSSSLIQSNDIDVVDESSEALMDNENVNINNKAKSDSIDEAFKTEITMLNYLTVVTQEIKQTKNRLLLDEQYNILYDGMHLDAVDEKTQKYIKELADSIFNLKMSETKRERIEYLMEQEKAGAIKSAIPNPIGLFRYIC